MLLFSCFRKVPESCLKTSLLKSKPTVLYQRTDILEPSELYFSADDSIREFNGHPKLFGFEPPSPKTVKYVRQLVPGGGLQRERPPPPPRGSICRQGGQRYAL